MLFPTPEEIRQLEQIAAETKAGTLGPGEAAQRLEALGDPTLSYIFRSRQLKEAGDLDGAEGWCWKGLDIRPGRFTFYLELSNVRRERDLDDPLAAAMLELAMRVISALESVPDGVTELFQSVGDIGMDFADPETYAALAAVQENKRREKGEPAAVTERILPYRLATQLQSDASRQVDAGTVDAMIENAPRVAPVLFAALRDWVRHPGSSLDTAAAAMFTAMLGEIGGADLVPDLLELACDRDREIAMHANWAVSRLGERFPSETLAALREGAGDPHVSLRCAIADQLCLLPEGLDIKPVARMLLDGFDRFAKDSDAPYLLATVALVALLDSEKEAREYIIRYGALLPPEGWAWLRERSETEDGFVPQLMAAEIDELDIYDVCADRTLLEEEEEEETADEDDFDFQDEDDFEDEDEEEYHPQTVVARPRPGRNDPCWCGSGKKYKKCHLIFDEERDRAAEEAAEEPDGEDVGDPFAEEAKSPIAEQTAQPPAIEAPLPESPAGREMHRRISQAVLAGAERWYPKSEWRKGLQLYFGEEGPPENDDDAMERFMDWFLHDHRPRSTGRSAFAEYVRVESNRLSAEERAMAESMRDARYGLYEVRRVEPGRGLEVEDVFRGERFCLADVTASRELVRWDCILNRVEQRGGRHDLAGDGQIVARALVEPLRRFIEEESAKAGSTASEFVSANAHRIHRYQRELQREWSRNRRLANALGEPIEFSSAEYRIVGEEEAALAVLRGIRVLREGREEAGGHRFAWVESEGDSPSRSYGQIELGGGRLKLESQSRQRLEAGRRMLEEALGTLVRHEIDRFQTVEEAMRASRKDRAKDAKATGAKLDPRRAAEIVGKAKKEHYAKWPDEALPALDGKTPRQAMATEAGRRAVRDLVRGIENIEERARTRGDAAFDAAGLRRELGLTEE